jgi:hypothetical protein
MEKLENTKKGKHGQLIIHENLTQNHNLQVIQKQRVQCLHTGVMMDSLREFRRFAQDQKTGMGRSGLPIMAFGG